MPIGYLITVVLMRLATWFALTPPRRPALLRRSVVIPGGVVNEIPLVVLAFLAASTGLAFGQGDIDTIPAWACVGLAAATTAALIVVAYRATLARPALMRALDAGLGSGAPGSRLLSAPGPGSLAKSSLLPWSLPRRDLERLGDIPYGDEGRHNLLDVYSRRGERPGGPTLVYFHGGGYFSGGKRREARPLLHRLAAEGWTCISANYRLRPSASLPDHLIDAKKVIAWARTHVGDSQGEPAPIFVAGSSAGGHLAALAALTPNVRSLQPGFESADTSVSAAICLYAYFGNYYGRGADSSPLGHVGADAPPFFIAQGDLDTHSARFLALARGFAEGLSDVSASPVVYAELPGAQHAFDIFGSVRFAVAVDAIVASARSVGAPGSARSPRSAAPGGRRARIG